MNSITLVGRLTRDAELKFLQNGNALCKFTIAVDRAFKKDDGPTADFFNVNLWGKRAEKLVQYLEKGGQVGVVGRCEIDNFEDKDGNKRTFVSVNASDITLLGGGKGKKADPINEKKAAEYADGCLPF